MKILDATCGSKTIWYQKNHPYVIFLDKENKKIDTKTENVTFRCRVRRNINPDIMARWENLPFKDKCFDMVVFDPPFKIENRNTKELAIEKYYGRLFKDTWKQIIKNGVKELFRVLKPNGIFILKWCETDKKVDEVLKLFPYKPLFGTRTGQSNKNHWIVFLKYDINLKLDKY